MAKKELTNSQKKEWAKTLYLKENISQKEIAKKVGISQQSMTKWVNTEGWDKLKSSLTITRSEQLKRLYDQVSAMNDTIANRDQKYPTPAEADTLSKLSSAIDKLERETSIKDIITVSKDICEWLRKNDHDKAKEVSNIFDEFIKHKIN